MASSIPNLVVDNGVKATTWKSGFAQQLAAVKTEEEIQGFLQKLFDPKQSLEAPDRFKHALEGMRSKRDPQDLDEVHKKRLPENSKVCIIGAGMAGMIESDSQEAALMLTRLVHRDDPRPIEDRGSVIRDPRGFWPCRW